MADQYGLKETPKGWVKASDPSRPIGAPTWYGDASLPALGDRVRVTFNSFGDGTIVGYFVDQNYLGVEVEVDKQPEWHIRQGGTNPIRVFGPEVRKI